MGNVAIALIQNSITLSEIFQIKRQKRIEHKRIRSLIPRYIARLNNCDISITTLNLNGLGVDAAILRLLSGPLVSGETNVQELYLQNNWIGPEAATCLARILSRDSHLKEVSLAHNPVGCVGARAIASALEQNSSLEKLDLVQCDINDEGAQKLMHSLTYNSTLKFLHLEGNNMTSLGVFSLLKCVYDTTSMQSLWESNHVLRAFFSGKISIYNRSFPETAANRQLIQQILSVLATCNRRYSVLPSKHDTKYNITARAAACKILRHYLRREKFPEYWECVEGMEEKLIPNVVGWLVRYGNIGEIYGVVRDMPWLLEKKTVGINTTTTGNYEAELLEKKMEISASFMIEAC